MTTEQVNQELSALNAIPVNGAKEAIAYAEQNPAKVQELLGMGFNPREVAKDLIRQLKGQDHGNPDRIHS